MHLPFRRPLFLLFLLTSFTSALVIPRSSSSGRKNLTPEAEKNFQACHNKGVEFWKQLHDGPRPSTVVNYGQIIHNFKDTYRVRQDAESPDWRSILKDFPLLGQMNLENFINFQKVTDIPSSQPLYHISLDGEIIFDDEGHSPDHVGSDRWSNRLIGPMLLGHMRNKAVVHTKIGSSELLDHGRTKVATHLKFVVMERRTQLGASTRSILQNLAPPHWTPPDKDLNIHKWRTFTSDGDDRDVFYALLGTVGDLVDLLMRFEDLVGGKLSIEAFHVCRRSLPDTPDHSTAVVQLGKLP